MIIATLTFLASIFGINTAELFFLNDFDKGVKEYVIDKER